LPLVKSPTMTPRKIAANRASASKSTGPRTVEGQRRVMLNSLRHGGRSQAFRTNLIKAGQPVELFDWIHERVRSEILTSSPRVAEGLARRVWCGLCLARKAGQRLSESPPSQASLWCMVWTPWRGGGFATKPRFAVKSMEGQTSFLSAGVKIRIEDPNTQRRMVFWVRKRRGAKVRLPVTAWPEIAAWVMMRTRGLHAGEQRMTRKGARPSAGETPGLGIAAISAGSVEEKGLKDSAIGHRRLRD
jgi:hypothetical protein